MTQLEFNHWWADYSTRFPDTGLWVSKVPAAAGLLAIWQEALSGTDLGDALEVNRQLTRGDLERWKTSSGYHEREETPAMIRKLAWGLKRERGDNQEKYERVSPNSSGESKFPIGILFRQLVAANERCAKDPSLDKAAEHRRLQQEFLAKYSAKPLKNRETAFDAYNAS